MLTAIVLVRELVLLDAPAAEFAVVFRLSANGISPRMPDPHPTILPMLAAESTAVQAILSAR